MTEKICGIYKITSPTGKVYIGQSIDIFRRWGNHKRQFKYGELCALYNSFKKHGYINHIHEIIQVCEEDILNHLERYWQEFYISVEKGLNCKYTSINGRFGKLSEETKRKIGDAQLGEKNHRWGKKVPKHKNPRWGKKLPICVIDKIRAANTGKKRSEESKIKYSKSRIGEKNPMFGTISPHAKKVIDTETGKVYNSAREAGNEIGVPQTTLRWWLQGRGKNKTNFKYI